MISLSSTVFLVVDESSLARRLVHSQLASPGYSDVTEHISFRLAMLLDDFSGSGSGSSSSITSTLLSLLPSSSSGIFSDSTASTTGVKPDDVKVTVQVHGSAALHIVDSRLAVDLSVAMSINLNHHSDGPSNKCLGEGGGGGLSDHGDQKMGTERLASLREAIIAAESMSVLAPALHAEVKSQFSTLTHCIQQIIPLDCYTI